MLTRPERDAWLLREIAEERAGVDVMNADFVLAFINHTDAKFDPTHFGAYHCPILGRDLARLAKQGKLKRSRVGLSGGAWMEGFPKWVWNYVVNKSRQWREEE